MAVAARGLGLECHEVESVNDESALGRIRQLAPEVVVVVAFGQLLKKELLALPTHGCINFHPSLLPRYRGAAPVQRAVLDGVVDSGLTVMRLVRKMDAGPILAQQPWRLDPDLNAAELLEQAGSLGAGMLIDVLARLPEIVPHEQPHAQATFAPPLNRQDGDLHFGHSALSLHNRVRAVQPWPRAHARLMRTPEVRVIVHRTRPEAGQGTPGAITGINKDGIAVACSDGVLRITEAQLEGKPARPARDVANGLRLQVGERFQ